MNVSSDNSTIYKDENNYLIEKKGFLKKADNLTNNKKNSDGMGFQFLVHRFSEDLSSFTNDEDEINLDSQKKIINIIIFTLLVFLGVFIVVILAWITWKFVIIFYYLCGSYYGIGF